MGTTIAPSALTDESHAPHSRVSTFFFVGHQHTDKPDSVLALTIPTAFFAAIDSSNNNGSKTATGPTDTLRDNFLQMSRGFSIILLLVCASLVS